jgi:hypothetical protein
MPTVAARRPEMTQNMTEVRHLRPGAGPHNDQHPTQDANNSVRRTAADVQAELAATVARAQKLVEQIAGQVEADQREFNLGYQLGFGTGIDIGYRRAMQEIAEQQAAVNRRLVKGIRQADAIEFARRTPQLWARCVEPGCQTRQSVPYRSNLGVVLCITHQPRVWCSIHEDDDRCGYRSLMANNLRPEFMGLAGGAA